MRHERSKGDATPSTETPAARERRVACVDTSIHRGWASYRECFIESDARHGHASKRDAGSERAWLLCSHASVSGENGATSMQPRLCL